MAPRHATDRLARAVTLGNDRRLIRRRPASPPTSAREHFHTPDRLRHGAYALKSTCVGALIRSDNQPSSPRPKGAPATPLTIPCGAMPVSIFAICPGHQLKPKAEQD